MKVEHIGKNPYLDSLRIEQKRGSSFMKTLKESIERLREVEKEAETEIERLAKMESKDIHNTMIAIEKADLTFQLMMQIRNKIISAYEEIMRMQV